MLNVTSSKTQNSSNQSLDRESASRNMSLSICSIFQKAICPCTNNYHSENNYEAVDLKFETKGTTSLLQKKMLKFGDNYFKLEKLDENTPLMFQWFNLKTEVPFSDNDVPILNTKENPYLNNIIHAAKIENERIIGIFVDGNFTNGHKQAFKQLEKDFKNIKVIYNDDLDFTEYDIPISKVIENYFTKMKEQKQEIEPRLYREIIIFQEENKDQTLLSYYKKMKTIEYPDFYRNLIMLKASNAFIEAKKEGCEKIKANGGCIYLDCDMVLKGKIGEIHSPDGFSAYIDRSDKDYPSLENGLFAVHLAKHGVLKMGLEEMHSNPFAHPYYQGFCDGIRKYFKYSTHKQYNSLCKLVEFKNSNIDMNTSIHTESSWRGKKSYSLTST